MGDSKSIGQLLKELDAMQKQFNHLNEELIVNNRKKKRVKTELSSNDINDDFFKTFSAPLIEKATINEEQEKKPEKKFAEDELIFELETEKENRSTVDNKLSKEENIETKNKNIEKSNESIFEQKTKIKDFSYLTIKQRLEKIQQEITLKEEALKEVKLKNKQQFKNKTIKLIQDVSTSNTLAHKEGIKVNNRAFKKNSSVLKPTKQSNPTIEKPKSKIKSAVLNPKKKASLSSKLKNKKTTPLNHKKNVSKKVKINSAQNDNVNIKKTSTERKVTKHKDKKIETVDQLTIIILILLIVLLVTAWVLLF